MTVKPFLKWAGGKRWLVGRGDFSLPSYSGRYIEPFLGGGAVFFYHGPDSALLSDVNPRLIETYQAIKDDWRSLQSLLELRQNLHSHNYYYEERRRSYSEPMERAAQFLYLNRACWNGLYRENLRGEFNVPIGTKDKIIFEDDNFSGISEKLSFASIECCDFEKTISKSLSGDLIFVDPPYTTAHNMNGFVKYNQSIFTWEDQIRLKDCLVDAVRRGVKAIVTNAMHESIVSLYAGVSSTTEIPRHTVISGSAKGRRQTSEALILMGFN